MITQKQQSEKSIALPTERKKPKNNLGDFTYLFAGEKKCGKTSFVAQWPDHFILECEPGNAAHLDCNYEDIYEWDAFVSYIDLLEQNPNYCKTIIIDELAVAYELLTLKIRKELKLADTEPLGYTGWGAAKIRFHEVIKRIQNLKPGAIYTAHTKIKTVELRTGKEVSKLETSLSDQAAGFMDNYTVFWGVMLFENEGKRVIQIQGDTFIKASNGFPDHFLRRDGTRMDKIPMGNSPQEAYSNFLRAFNNDLVNGQNINPIPASTNTRPVFKKGSVK